MAGVVKLEEEEAGGVDDDEDRASIVSLGESDSTNGPFFWYRVVCNISPKGRNCHTASMVGDKMMVFGGFGGSKWFDELWVFDTHLIEWSRPEVRAAGQGSPAARYAHSAVSFRGLLFIFGGYGGNDEWLDDLWVLDTQAIRVRDQKKAAMAWFRPQTTGFSPTPRAAHTANVVGQKLFIFGAVASALLEPDSVAAAVCGRRSSDLPAAFIISPMACTVSGRQSE